MNILVDSSIWSLALRRRSVDLNPTERALVVELTQLISEGRARIIGLVRQEVLSGIKTAVQFEKVREALEPFRDEPTETSDYESAARAGNACRSKGIAVSTADMLICAVGASRGWSIFTTDPDFKHYEQILSIQLHSIRA
ncbi:MAG: PIN domain-containing protein [Candidatus Acidiferrales bacterium]